MPCRRTACRSLTSRLRRPPLLQSPVSSRTPPAPATRATRSFSLTINTTTGAYEFQLFDELIHKAPASGADENFDLRSGNAGATIPGIDFGSIVTVTDKDGDTITLDGKFTINVRDDIPEADIDLKNSSVTIDETHDNQNDDTSSELRRKPLQRRDQHRGRSA